MSNKTIVAMLFSICAFSANAAVWQDAAGHLYDDNNGAALSLPTWPAGLTQLTPTQAYALQHPVMPPTPNAQGFQDALKVASGGIVAANALSTAYPLLVPAIQQQVWPDVQALILDAHTKGVINATQYAAFQAAAAANNIPITLP